MPKFLVTIHHAVGYDSAVSEDDTMRSAIDALNDEMVSAGIRVFVGGLHPASRATSLVSQPDGRVVITDGPYLQTQEYVAGFWVLDLPDLEQALAWGSKAAIACRAPVEVRPFH